VPGGFSEWVLVRERAVRETAFGLPPHLADEAAVFLEPAACVLRAVRQARLAETALAGPVPGCAAILGGGGMGLLHLLVLKAVHPSLRVAVSDPLEERLALARRLGADGVHLGQGDGDVRDAREELGREVQIGVTCHASRDLALAAGEAGADYVAFGAFFPSTTKSSEHRPELDLLTWWQTMIELPCVAIGGITPANCGPLVRAGADFLAMSAAVWQGDEADNVRAFHRAIAAAASQGANDMQLPA
jgi:thiamine-phosphate diphosphorylase